MLNSENRNGNQSSFMDSPDEVYQIFCFVAVMVLLISFRLILLLNRKRYTRTVKSYLIVVFVDLKS